MPSLLTNGTPYELLGVMVSYIADFAYTRPDHLAVVMGETNKSYTYKQLDNASIQVANMLHGFGLGFGSAVAILLENSIEMFEVMWACQRLGIRYTPISTRLTVAEVAYIVNDCGAEVYITSQRFSQLAIDLIAYTPRVRTRVMVGDAVDGYRAYADLKATASIAPTFEQLEGAPMLYSSGTTGRPKGIKRPHVKTPVGSSAPLAVFMETPLRFSEDTVYLNPAPLYHAAPLAWSMTVQRFGGTVVCLEHFDAVTALDLIQRHQITHGQFVPTMFVRMLKLPADVRDSYDVSSLQAVVHAAAPCPVDVKRAMIAWWGPIIYEFYAATEGHGATFLNSHQWLEHPGSVGRPIMGEIHICDDNNEELPIGEVGTIWFGGVPGVLEYHNDPEKTAEAHHPNGWVTVWDIGRVDTDGYLYLTDRKSHMIIAGGVNIYPQESEDVLISHPLVADAAVIGVPDEEMGEQVKGVVQLVDPAQGTPEIAEFLIAHCRSKLAAFKCPKTIDFVAELPRQENGKLYKRALRDQYWSTQGSKVI